MEDEKIIALYWDRDQTAIAETQQKYGRYCGSIAHNIVHDAQDAEECVNDTWMRAWNSMPRERPHLLAAFLGAITRNLSLDCYRRKHSEKRGGGGRGAADADRAKGTGGVHQPVPGGAGP